MALATYVQNGEHLDWYNDTGADVAYKEIIDLDTCLVIAQAVIAAGTTGAVAVGGVYDLAAATNDDFDFGEKLYWDGTKLVASDGSGANTPAGICVLAKATTTATARVLLIAGM